MTDIATKTTRIVVGPAEGPVLVTAFLTQNGEWEVAPSEWVEGANDVPMRLTFTDQDTAVEYARALAGELVNDLHAGLREQVRRRLTEVVAAHSPRTPLVAP